MQIDIIAATDLSSRSDRAVDRAFELSRRYGMSLGVCHAVKPGSVLAQDTALAEVEVRSALPDPKVDVEVLLPVGPAPQAITETAELAGAKLIVTGVARFNSLGDYFLGTAVEHIVRNAAEPVLIVKKRAHRPYRRLLVATDFSSCSLHALKAALELFPDCEFHLFHAWHVAYEGWKYSAHVKEGTQEAGKERLAQFLARPDMPDGLAERLTVHLQYGGFGTALLELTAQLEPDLIVLGTHGESGFFKAMSGRTALSALEWTDCDALVAREPVALP